MKKLLLTLTIFCFTNFINASTINIVAAENFYGELVHEIGGNNVSVTSIINNPNADPHLFTTSPAISESLTKAQIIIYNGANYDAWINQMLTQVDSRKVIVINVANLVGVKSSDNPHIWYKPETFPILARLIAAKINQLNPKDIQITNNNLNKFLDSNQALWQKIANLKIKHAGTKVIATEPVFGYMTDAIGLEMQALDFQWKIMNDTEPTPKMIANYENLLNTKQVKVLFYNNQVADSLTKTMQEFALKNSISVVGINETMPKGMTINVWLEKEINETSDALRRR